MKQFVVPLAVLALLVGWREAAAADLQAPDRPAVERVWKSGETLPAEMAARFPNPPLRVPNDTGINVLVDLAHQCAFATLWGLTDRLHPLGFRSIVSHASLDTVLTPGRLSRMRVPAGKSEDGMDLRPFGWVPNPRFNVLVTFQSEPNAQPYLPEERAAVERFVKDGGGLVLIDHGVGRTDKKRLRAWADLSLATTFGVDFKAFIAGQTTALLGADWEIVRQSGNGAPSVARRAVGRGRVVLLGGLREIEWDDKTPKDAMAAKKALLKETMTWAAGGREPVGGEARFSQTLGGGGGIYPELEERLKGAVVYYARNQKSNILQAVRQELPRIADKLYAWLPSPVPEEPMFIIQKWGSGKVWKKLWWIWQKLDDRYGTTWYPRWRWVQHTRWQDDPGRQLNMDEMVEDMSIACGEDLAPFFKKIGTTLKRNRIESATFQGKAIALPVAPIEVSPAGNARHDPIGDFTKPIKAVAP